MCKCKGKCGCNISTITKGEKGDTGSVNVLFYSFKAQTVDSPSTVDVQTAVVEDGDYVVQLEMTFTNTDVVGIGVISNVLKNGSLDSSNDNYEHAYSDLAPNKKRTYTHTAKITGLTAGQTVGYRLSSDGIFVANNGSLTIFKML
jgi:hypothetical protein